MHSSRTAVIVALGMLVSAAHATDRYYDDQTVFSPNRKLRLEAKSPDNAKLTYGRKIPFAKDFVYRLFDNDSGREIWVHKQGKDQGSPCAIFIDDKGHTVIQGAWDDIQCLDPKTGNVIVTASMLRKLPDAERDKYVQDTTAGPFWEQCSTWRFVTLENEPHFYVRSWWGRRLLINVARGQVLDDPSGVEAAIDRLDREFVLETLQIAAGHLKADIKASYEDQGDLRAALLMAARLKVRDAVPLLRVIERSEYVTCTSFGDWGKQPTGSVCPGNFEEFGWRQAAQFALRRLGERPQAAGCTRFRLETGTDKRGTIVTTSTSSTDRAAGADKITTGMSPKDVLELVGAPDFVVQRRPDESVRKWRQYWEFDMDADEPFTLRLIWTDDGRVESKELLKPVLWRVGETREFDIVW